MRVTGQDLGVRLGGRVVLAGLGFDWRGPGIVCVTGPNGSGKTTLLKVLAGLLRPGRGVVGWEEDGRSLTPGEARSRVGFAGPEVGLYEDLDALENLGFLARARGHRWNAAEACAGLARVGLAGREHERLSVFSSGMKQRMKLAFAFSGQPPLVLLDEPGSNLDAAGRALTRELVEEAARTALVVVATNDDQEARWGTLRLELLPSPGPAAKGTAKAAR